jgi:hypothetical protein
VSLVVEHGAHDLIHHLRGEVVTCLENTTAMRFFLPRTAVVLQDERRTPQSFSVATLVCERVEVPVQDGALLLVALHHGEAVVAKTCRPQVAQKTTDAALNGRVGRIRGAARVGKEQRRHGLPVIGFVIRRWFGKSERRPTQLSIL